MYPFIILSFNKQFNQNDIAMLVIRCTSKLLKELDVHKSNIYDYIQPDNLLGSWYANVILINRRKCLLFVNDKTLFVFLIPGIKKSDLKNFKELFIENLKSNLTFLGIDHVTVEQICNEYQEFEIGKTLSKSVLGSMTDYARCYKFELQYSGGQLVGDILQINSEMNKMPMGAIDYSNGERMLLNFIDRMAT